MKILFIIPELGYGGAESALLRLARELAKHNSVTIAVFRRSYQQGNYADVELNTALPVVELDHSRQPLPSWIPNRIARWWRRASALHELKKQCDVAISFLGGANFLNALVRSGKPCVLSERGSKRYDRSRKRLTRWIWCWLLDPFAYRRADRVVCVSKGLSREISQSLPRHQRYKVLTISGYLDPEKALAARDAPIEPELLCLANRPMLVAAGRLHPQKGFHYLLSLFAQVAPCIPGSGLLIIGDGPLLGDLISFAENLGLCVSHSFSGIAVDPEAQVIFLGYRPMPARYTKLGRAFVMPSLWEGLPNLLLEAVAAGSWCIAADCPWGPSEILRHKRVGELLPPIDLRKSDSSWISVMKRTLKSPKFEQSSFQFCNEWVKYYSIQKACLAWEDMLRTISKGG